MCISLQASAQDYRVTVEGICHHSSKMMHMFFLLVVTICLLSEPVTTQSLSYPSLYPFWPRAHDKCYCPTNSYCARAYNRYDCQCGNGWHWVRDPTTDCTKKMYMYTNGHPTCGEGVWMRIGFIDTTRAFSECPSPLEMFIVNNRKYCRRSSSGCTSVYFDSLNQQYTEVCGMVNAYQYGHMDAFQPSSTSINSLHLEGISITHKSPRQHLWSYVVGDVANPSTPRADSCPCTAQGTTSSVPSVIGSDYYCSSGNSDNSGSASGVMHSSRLWRTSGPSCVSGSTCCDNRDQPWFKKKLTQPANEDVEMRWCAGDQPTSEATATTRVELYIRVD